MKYAQFLLASILGPPWFLILLFSLLPEPPLGCLTDISLLTYLKPNSPHSPTLPTFLPTSPYSFPHFINAALPFHFFLSLIQSTSKNEEKQLALPSEYIQNPSLFPLPPKWSSSFPNSRQSQIRLLFPSTPSVPRETKILTLSFRALHCRGSLPLRAPAPLIFALLISPTSLPWFLPHQSLCTPCSLWLGTVFTQLL